MKPIGNEEFYECHVMFRVGTLLRIVQATQPRFASVPFGFMTNGVDGAVFGGSMLL